MNPHTFPKGHFALLMKVNIMAASIEVNEVIKVGGIQNTLVLWQTVFLAASPLAMAAPPPKLYFALSRSPYRQLRRLDSFRLVQSSLLPQENWQNRLMKS